MEDICPGAAFGNDARLDAVGIARCERSEDFVSFTAEQLGEIGFRMQTVATTAAEQIVHPGVGGFAVPIPAWRSTTTSPSEKR